MYFSVSMTIALYSLSKLAYYDRVLSLWCIVLGLQKAMNTFLGDTEDVLIPFSGLCYAVLMRTNKSETGHNKLCSVHSCLLLT